VIREEEVEPVSDTVRWCPSGHRLHSRLEDLLVFTRALDTVEEGPGQAMSS
jgi:hypothetical protein